MEVGRGSGSDSQGTTTVKSTGNVDWYLLLDIEKVVIMEERECAEARQEQPVNDSPARERGGHGCHNQARAELTLI